MNVRTLPVIIRALVSIVMAPMHVSVQRDGKDTIVKKVIYFVTEQIMRIFNFKNRQ